MAGMEETRRFDIVRKENEKAMFWLEGVADLSAAKLRVQQLLSFWPGEYQVFDLSTRQVVHTTGVDTSAESGELSIEVPVGVPASNRVE
jgi:hypothetical protein